MADRMHWLMPIDILIVDFLRTIISDFNVGRKLLVVLYTAFEKRANGTTGAEN